MLGAPVHRLANLRAEAAAAECDGIAGDRLPIEPGRAGRVDLGGNVEIGADGERDPPASLCVVEFAQLHDRARRAVAGRVEVGQLDVMGPSVRAIDDGVGRALQLVVETTIDQAADDGIVKALAGEHIAGGAAFDAALGQATVDALDNVATLAQFAQGHLGILGHGPLAGADLIGEAERLQLAQAADLHRVEFVGLAVRVRREIDDTGAVAVSGKLPVKVGPALRVDLPFEIAADLVIGARSQLLGNEILRAGAHAFLDVVAGDDEVLGRHRCARAG